MFFIVAVEILAVVSVLGIWEVFGRDVIEKSVATLGLLAFVSVVVLIAGRFIHARSVHDPATPPEVPNPIFTMIRRITLGFLIACASLLALLGVLAIWEVIPDKDVLFKSLGTLATLAFAAFVIVMACLEREKAYSSDGEKAGFSLGSIVLAGFLIYLAISISSIF